jgi:hypothetical protein
MRDLTAIREARPPSKSVAHGARLLSRVHFLLAHHHPARGKADDIWQAKLRGLVENNP